MTILQLKKGIVKYCRPIYKLYRRYKTNKYMLGDAKIIADKCYLKDFGRHIDWEHPTEFNEKIRWMQFNTDISMWTLLADKYRVRKFVEAKGYRQILIPLLGVWEKAEEIDFDKLPNSFVIKTNHGCGEVIVVNNKEQEDLENIRAKMKQFLNTPFGYFTAETHYLKIKPVIIAEKKMYNDSSWSSSMVDYKFYCFYGKPFCCGVFFNRNIVSHTKEAVICDMEWKRHDEWLEECYKPQNFIDVPRPKCFDQMVQSCHDLAAEFPFVRMDFYEVGERYFFGEFTFTPAACRGGVFNKEFLVNILSPLLKI